MRTEGVDDPVSVSIHTVKTENFAMDYARFGNGEAAFVILPGLSVQSVLGFADAVAEQYKSFAEGYTVYLFDRRQDIPAVYTIADMARDTAAAMESLGLENACVYGASQGGMIAMVIAMEHPALVRKLALASTTACVTEERLPAIENWIALAQAGQAEALYMAFGEAIYPHDVFEAARASIVEAAKTVTAAEMERFVILAEGVQGFDVTEGLKNIACPTFVVGSRDDRVFSEDAFAQLAAAIPGAELYMYDGYGHAVYDTAPDFVDRMLTFFRRS